MTIGSPIDKHLVLWPRLWDPELWKAELTDRVQTDTSAAMARAHANPPIPPNPIRWRNYYDLGDPIGFKLDVARDWLEEHGCTAFEFRSEHDMEFSRYWLPGEAHNEYWNDPDVFGHFIDTVVTPKETVTPAPKSKLLGRLSPALPYALSVACHAGAVFVLLKSVLAYSSEHFPLRDVALETAVLTILLAGTTVATRLPRLVKPGWGWGLASVVAFVVGAVVYLTFMPDEVVERLSPPLIKAGLTTETARFAAEYAIVGLAFIVTLIAWLIQRKPRYARRALLLSGTVAVALIVFTRLLPVNSELPIWPVLLGGAAFVYLWWLGILVFDLAFMWHRYVRASVAIDNLRHWRIGEEAPSALEACLQNRRERKQGGAQALARTQ